MEIANCTYLCKPNNCFALGEKGGFWDFEIITHTFHTAGVQEK